ncbi:MAG: glycosyltransferase WbuB [Candidatus Poseidoniia archaeon]|jgi:colanic acid biosynthesis glycosyl transferase WcaI|nr:glycosyltransferase WbuB [Candidatus Poseidoniia archaeon]
MKLTLVSLNYSPELTGIGKYNGEMAPWLADQGADVSVICAPPYYPEWQVHKGFSGVWYSVAEQDGVQVIRCPLYVPKTPTTLKRLLHLASFSISSSLALFKGIFRKPEVVIVVEPTLFVVPSVLLFCKVTGAKSVLHIQDYEVDAMFGLGMGGKPSGLLSRFAFGVERWLMGKFDAVSTISLSMMDKAREKGVSDDKLIFFPNWSNTDFVNPDVDGSALRDSWGVKESEKVVLYAGNIGAKQGLELVIGTAKRYISRTEVKFFVVGAGAYVKQLQALSYDAGLTNIEFKPLQAWEDVPAMLSMADVHLVVQRKGAADSVLPSKLTNILSAGGNAVVTAESDTELGRLAEQYPGIYSCVGPEDIDAFCKGLDVELGNTGTNTVARKYAEENLNKDAILSRFREDLLNLVNEEITEN